MNYVVTFTDRNCIDNILQVWLPTLKRNFSGNIVVIVFDVDKEDIEKLKKEEVTVIEEDSSITGIYKVIAKRLEAEEKFINMLNDEDKIMLIDGADVVFQSNIDNFFDKISDKIIYSTTGTVTNEPTLKWLKRLFKYFKDKKTLIKQLEKEEIKASGMLAGNKLAFIKYFKRHKDIIDKFKVKYFTGINQAILTYLIFKYPNEFEKTDIHNCRIRNENIIRENGLYKIKKTIPIIHFSRSEMKPIYENLYLNKNTKDKLNILWLYGSNKKFDKINHWYHIGFARVLANKPNVNLMVYGYDMCKVYPDLAKIPFDERKTGKDIFKEFPFNIIIMDNKNRFAYTQTAKERRNKVSRQFWLKPEFFKGLDNIPKIFLEGDYHLHFHMNRPDEKNWYRDRKVDLLLVRHLSALNYHKDNSIPIQWFPCSVNEKIFKPDFNKQRKEKICLISGYGINYYKYRNTAGKILESKKLIDIYPKRFIGKDYIDNLQTYICHLSGSSIRAITPAKMFEIMASGSVLLTDEGEEYGLKELFPNDSYATYNKKTYYDLIPKAKEIVVDKDYRNHLIQKALKCIKSQHTHEIRAQELLNIITDRFKISYQKEVKSCGLIEKLYNLFTPNVPVNTQTVKPEIMLSEKTFNIEEKAIKKNSIEDQNIDRNLSIKNEEILRKLYNENIKIYALKATCYEIIVNNKIGNDLSIAVNDKELAKKVTGNLYSFLPNPKNTRKFIYKNMVLHVPYPVIAYLKDYYGNKILEALQAKDKKLKLVNGFYKFVKRG